MSRTQFSRGGGGSNIGGPTSTLGLTQNGALTGAFNPPITRIEKRLVRTFGTVKYYAQKRIRENSIWKKIRLEKSGFKNTTYTLTQGNLLLVFLVYEGSLCSPPGIVLVFTYFRALRTY